MKTVQDMKIEKEPLKKTQTKIKQEMQTLGSQTKTWGKPGQCSIRHGRETIIEGKVREIAMSVKKMLHLGKFRHESSRKFWKPWKEHLYE